MKLKKLLCITAFCFVYLAAGCSSNNKKDSDIHSSYKTEQENSEAESSDIANKQEDKDLEKDNENSEDSNSKEDNTNSENNDEKKDNTNSEEKQDNTNSENNNEKKDNTNSEDNNLKQDNTNSEDNDLKQDNTNSEDNDLKQDNTNSEDNDSKKDNTNSENNDSKKDNINSEKNNTNSQEAPESLQDSPQANADMNGEDNGFYQTCTSRSSSEVENFAENIKSLVLEKDWSGLSELIAYPISIDGAFYNDSTAFLAIDFENNLNPDFLSSVEAETCHEMFHNWQGISMGANGEIWFKDVYSDESNSSLQITALNNILIK